MARARNIKPGFFRNLELAELPPEGQLLFIGLWTLADREGRLKDIPRWIKAELFPYSDFDVVRDLTALAGLGFISRYSAAGSNYIQITNFKKHQNPHVKEPASTIPAPDKPGAKPVLVPGETGASPADSLIPDPGSLTADSRDWPKTAAAVRQFYPDADDRFLKHLVAKVIEKFISVRNRDPADEVTDEAMAQAVVACKKPNQHSAALFLTTVPQCIASWAQQEAS